MGGKIVRRVEQYETTICESERVKMFSVRVGEISEIFGEDLRKNSWMEESGKNEETVLAFCLSPSSSNRVCGIMAR